MNTSRIKLPYYISVLLTLFLSLDLHAQVAAVSPATEWMTAINQNLKQFIYEFEKSSTINLQLPQGQIVSEQVGFTGRFHLQSLSPDHSTGQLQLGFTIENAEVLAKNVNIQISMKEDLSFGSATINLNVQCGAISIRSKNPQQVSAMLDSKLQIKQLLASLQNSSLETNLIGCNSIAGLEGAIQQKALEFVRAQIINDQIYQTLSAEIASQLNRKVMGFASTFASGAAQIVNTKAYIDDQLRFWVIAGTTIEDTFSNEELNILGQSAKSSALVKKSFLEKALLDQINLQIEKSSIQSKDDSSLKKLTCSRWAQFFAWPALMALPKCFNMQVVSLVQEVKIIDLKQMSLAVKVGSWVTAPEQNRNIAYFSSQTSVSAREMKSKIEKFVGQHFPEFLSWAQKSKRISTSLMQTALQEYLDIKLSSLKTDKSALFLQRLLNSQNASLVGTDAILLQLK